MAGIGGAPAAEDFSFQLGESGEQVRVFEEPGAVLAHDFFARAVFAHYKGIAPDGGFQATAGDGAADVDVVRFLLAVNHEG